MKELTLRLPTRDDVRAFRNKVGARMLGVRSLADLASIISNNMNYGTHGSGGGDSRFVYYHNFNIWVYVTTRVVLDNAMRLAASGAGVYREKYERGLRKRERVETSHPASMLIESPNSAQTFPEFVEEVLLNDMLSGMFYIKKEMSIRPREMWSLRATRCRVIPGTGKVLDKNKRPMYYDGFVYDEDKPSRVIFSPDRISYGKRANPMNEYVGMSPFFAARNSINIFLAAQKYNMSFYENDATPGGYLQTDFAFSSPEQAQKWARVWFKMYGGGANRHKVAVLGNNLNFKTLTPSHKDMMFGEQMKQVRDEIAAAGGVPSIYLNDTDKANYANLREHEKLLWRRTMIPVTDRVKYRINRDIMTEFDEGDGWRYVLDLDLSVIEALQEDIDKQANADARKIFSSVRTPDEIRERDGLAPYENGIGSVPVIQGAMAKLEDVGAVYAKTPPPEKGQAASGRRSLPAASYKHVYANEDERRALWESTRDLVEDYTDDFKVLIAKAFAMFEAEMLDNLDAAKGVKAPLDADAIVYDLEHSRAILTKSAHPFYQNATERGGERVIELVDSPVPFDMTDSNVVKLLDARKQRFAERIIEGKWKTMKTSLEAGIKNSETIPELALRVEAEMGRVINNAATIARTEVLPSFHEGQLNGMKQSGVVKGKEWLPAYTAMTRPGHYNAEQVVAINEAFFVAPDAAGAYGEDLEYPGDPSGMAENIINCLCDMLPVVE